jgi:hypothetical protein
VGRQQTHLEPVACREIKMNLQSICNLKWIDVVKVLNGPYLFAILGGSEERFYAAKPTCLGPRPSASKQRGLL